MTKAGAMRQRSAQQARDSARAVRAKPSLEAAMKPHERIARRLTFVRVDGLAAARSRYFASVGTSVREKKYEASIANTTASASGTNR